MDSERDDPTTDRVRKRRKTSSIAVYFPEEIVREILLNLPVKSLLRFRCVSRSWKALITDPEFVDQHLSASMKDKVQARHRLIMTSACHGSEVKSLSIESVFRREESPDIQDHNYPLKHPQRSVSIAGSVNGLVCIVVDKGSIFVWNPSTRKSKRLPNCGFKNRSERSIVYGFGYDESSSDFKVMVLNSRRPRVSPFKTEVKIYGLRSDSWRMVGDFPQGIPLPNASGVFVSGSLHWSGRGETGLDYYWSITKPIVSFDLSKETYSEFEQPTYERGASNSTLGVLRDCLCLLCNMSFKRSDVWVMKEYGNVESWSMLFSIHNAYWPENFQYSMPLCIPFMKKEVISLFRSRLVCSYRGKNKLFCSQTLIHNCLKGYVNDCIKAYIYIESLVSPDLQGSNR